MMTPTMLWTHMRIIAAGHSSVMARPPYLDHGCSLVNNHKHLRPYVGTFLTIWVPISPILGSCTHNKYCNFFVTFQCDTGKDRENIKVQYTTQYFEIFDKKHNIGFRIPIGPYFMKKLGSCRQSSEVPTGNREECNQVSVPFKQSSYSGTQK